MKCPYLRGVPWTMSSETLRSRSFVRKFSCAFERGLEREGEGAYLIWRNVSTGVTFFQDGLVVTGRYTTFSNNKKMAIILHRELEHKVEKVFCPKVGRHAAEDQKQYELPALIHHN